METNILGESRIECIHVMTPDETRLININWNQLDKYIELINHDMKMTILNNIAAAWFHADIDEPIPSELCKKIAQKYIDAGWDHVYYAQYTNRELRGKRHTEFFMSSMVLNIPRINSYTHVHKEIEKIRSAAIMYRKKGDIEFHYIEGRSHAQCIETFSVMDLYSSMRDTEAEIQGFMTTKDRFVDRVEALEIARKAGQVKESYTKDYLISEVIDWSK